MLMEWWILRVLDLLGKQQNALGIRSWSNAVYFNKDEYETFIASGISDMALPLYKKLLYYILEFPRIMQLRNAYSILECKGLNDTWLKVVSTLVNLPLKLFLCNVICLPWLCESTFGNYWEWILINLKLSSLLDKFYGKASTWWLFSNKY